jgi:hypothetical protein
MTLPESVGRLIGLTSLCGILHRRLTHLFGGLRRLNWFARRTLHGYHCYLFMVYFLGYNFDNCPRSYDSYSYNQGSLPATISSLTNLQTLCVPVFRSINRQFPGADVLSSCAGSSLTSTSVLSCDCHLR